MLNNQTQAFGLSIFVAELHKVVAASRLPNIAVLRLSYHHRTKEMQRLFFRVSIYRGKNGKIWAQNICRNTSSSTTLMGSSHADLLVAIQTTLLQEGTIILRKERIDPDPKQRED